MTNGRTAAAGGNHSLIFYDGVCLFCSRIARFIISRDKKSQFRFVAMQSEIGRRLLTSYGLNPNKLDTFVLIEEGNVYTRSTAELRVLRRLDRAWPLLYGFIVVPRPLRDAVYTWIAGNRYRWFGKNEACLVPDKEIRDRFLLDE